MYMATVDILVIAAVIFLEQFSGVLFVRYHNMGVDTTEYSCNCCPSFPLSHIETSPCNIAAGAVT